MPGNWVFPEASGGLSFVIIPAASQDFISPDASPGEGDSTIISFSVDHEANVSLNISAFYEPLSYSSRTYEDAAAYYMSNGTWLVALVEERAVPSDRKDLVLGIGSDASSFEWMSIGQVNVTDGIAVAAEGDKIRVVYLEKGISGVGEVGAWPIERVGYFSSDDFGRTWVNGTLLDCSSWNDTRFSHVSMVSFNGTFTAAWGFSNTSDVNYWRGESTIWESHHSGNVTESWSIPKNLTCFSNHGVHAYEPRLLVNKTSGVLYISVNNVSASGNCSAVLYELGNDVEALDWVDYWLLTITNYTSNEPFVYCALDDVTNKFYFINDTMVEQGIFSASSWKGSVGDFDPLRVRSIGNGFGFFASNGPKLFSKEVPTVNGGFSAGILQCQPPFNFVQVIDNISAYQTYSMVFNGRDVNGSSHGARVYYVDIQATSDGVGRVESYIMIGVDDTVATLGVVLSSGFISPFTSAGQNDIFHLAVNSSKSGIARFLIESNESMSFSVNLTDGLKTYSLPSFCGGGGTSYLFYVMQEGATNNKVMFSRSDDGGRSWGNGKAIMETVERIFSLKSTGFGNRIFCYVEDEINDYLIYSIDGGNSFIKTVISEPIDGFSSDHVAWRGPFNAAYCNISLSRDQGFNWDSFLSIPQSMFTRGYDYLEGVAHDPISGNYSFIFTNSSSMDVAFITATENGSEFSFTEDICDGGSPFTATYKNTMEVDVMFNSTGGSSWIITNSIYFPFSMENLTAPLAFRTTKGDGVFSEWDNLTQITGTNIPVTYVYWDIFFPVNGSPTCVKMIIDPILLTGKQVTLYSSSKLVYSQESNVFAMENKTFNFAGISGSGEILPDGEYKWTFRFVDQVGQSIERSGTLIIDNKAPGIINDSFTLQPALPVPSAVLNVSFLIDEAHLDRGVLSYRVSPTSEWVAVMMDAHPIAGSIVELSGAIPKMDETTVYWRVKVNDSAGNFLVIDDNGQPFSYRIPNIRIEEQSEVPSVIDVSKISSYDVLYFVSEDEQFVDYLTISYMYDDNGSVQVANMTRITGAMYMFSFTDIPSNATMLKYNITVHDLFGNNITFSKKREIDLIPPLPEWNITSDQKAFLAFISIVVGLVSGFIFSVVIKKKKGKMDLDVGTLRRKKSRLKDKNITISLLLSLTALGMTVILSAISIYVYHFPEGAMLSLAGTFLAAIVLWVILAIHSITKTIEERHEKLISLPLIYIVGISIFIILLQIIFIGNAIPWWRVRVNQQSFTFGPVTIPRMLTTLTSTFFSSILLLTWSIGKDVSQMQKELFNAERHNFNPGWLLRKKEENIAKLMNSVAFKALIFIAIIGSTIIFASDLSVYASQGLLIIVPFIIGTLLMLALMALYQHRKGKSEKLIVFDKLMVCPSCGRKTALGGSYCEECGTKLIMGTRKEKARKCETCGGLNPIYAKTCRFCGKPLLVSPKE
ncbi:MAG: hypothetical protein ACTSYS_07425 [Promethearchaeota archaeon]